MRKCVNKTISMSPKMIKLIEKASELTGVSFSEFLRLSALNMIIRLARVSPELRRELSELKDAI